MSEYKKLDASTDWNDDDLHFIYQNCERIATEKFKLDIYPNRIEVINSEQMLDAYAAIGMPQFYHHWSFGKQFVREQQMYKRGLMGLAYEIVINSNPCISYLMEENTLCLQAIVIAHAAMGHNSVFKNNFLFKQWTDAEGILSYLKFAKDYISECEERYGQQEVEELLDACHALRYHGVDRYKRPAPLPRKVVEQQQKDREEYLQYTYDDIWKTIPTSKNGGSDAEKQEKFPSEPQENLLYFLEKHTPNLPTWKREIIRIVRKINQYFYPQMQTQVLNEGRATQIHYWTMNEMYNEGLVTDGFMLEFLHNHSNVTTQRAYNQPGGQKINPYALGFAMFEDIKRICINPTDEDKDWFPEWAGCQDHIKMTQFAANDFKDDSFIQQFLSPKVMRDFRMFWIMDDEKNPKYYIKAIHDKEGYKQIREKLSQSYNITNVIPNIQVTNVDRWGDRSLQVTYYSKNGHRLHEKDASKTLMYLQRIWGYTCYLQTVDEAGKDLGTIKYSK